MAKGLTEDKIADIRIIRQRRDQPGHISTDLGSVIAAQDTDPFVAFPNVKITEIFVTNDRIGDPAAVQVIFTQVDPFLRKLTFFIADQRHEVPGKNILSVMVTIHVLAKSVTQLGSQSSVRATPQQVTGPVLRQEREQ